MDETKHFRYEGKIDLSKSNMPQTTSRIDILEVDFLTPAKIKAKKDGSEISFMVSVDIINRKVYDSDGQLFLSDEVFAYLDAANTLPEDFFMAPDEVLEQASHADSEHKRLRNDILGEYK